MACRQDGRKPKEHKPDDHQTPIDYQDVRRSRLSV